MTVEKAINAGLSLLILARLLAMIWVPLTDPTEARYAEIARKMAETGNWITPQFDYGVPFWAKPPLHTWLSAAGIVLLGPTPFAARLGILVSTLLTLAILWAWTQTFADRRTAKLAVLITSSSALFFIASAFVETDMALTLGVVSCMAGFHGGINGDRRWGWLFFLGLSIGLLAKGPVAIVLSMTPIAVWTVWGKHWNALHRLPWLLGGSLCLVLAVPWYVAAEIATPGFLHYFLIGEHIERFLQPGWTGDLYGAGRAQPRGTIWLFWIVAALPWSTMLPFALSSWWKSDQSTDPRTGDIQLYLLLFALTPMVFFTAAANILLAYVLPGIPAAAVLGVLVWRQYCPTAKVAAERWVTIGTAGVLALALALTGVCAVGLDRWILPSEDHLVSAFQKANTSLATLPILGQRSFSSEFYNRGRVKYLASAKTICEVLEKGLVAIPQSEISKFRSIDCGDNSIIFDDRKYALIGRPAPNPDKSPVGVRGP